MAKTSQNSIFFSFRGNIYFENQLLIEKNRLKIIHYDKMVFLSNLILVKFGEGGLTIIAKDRKFSKFQ